MSNVPQAMPWRMPASGVLTWLLPGLGHIYIGDHRRGVVLLVTMAVTFWSGVAIGGVRRTVDPAEHKVWFLAQVCVGGHTLSAWALNIATRAAPTDDGVPPYMGHWLSADIGVHYTGVAGLLNLLVIFDAIARADPTASGAGGGRGRRSGSAGGGRGRGVVGGSGSSGSSGGGGLGGVQRGGS